MIFIRIVSSSMKGSADKMVVGYLFPSVVTLTAVCKVFDDTNIRGLYDAVPPVQSFLSRRHVRTIISEVRRIRI